ncbi:hypothetical protein V496_02799 [Pseudogymnoascus sp. VKM F-4515 (FW-2607)]|nr:hypothetical protein V496_02799 [Pseudogymnoascus sp. VKM F-4515 (FW-2607)]
MLLMGLLKLRLVIFKNTPALFYLFGTIGAVAMSVSTASSSIAAIATHTVAVGAAGLVFTPNTILANVKDVVEFRFYPQNHSVARAEYRHSCIPYEYTGVNKVGFWSDFQPVNVVLQDVRLPKLMVLVCTNSLQPPQFSIVVNDTEPIFFYCSSPGACTQEGMVGVINPNSTQTLDVQLAYAENSTLMFSPGEGYPSETTTPATSPSSSSAPANSPITLSSGAIAGIAIGGIAMILLIAVLCLKWRRKTKGTRYTQNAPQRPPSYSSPSPLRRLEPFPIVYSPESPHNISPESPFNSSQFNLGRASLTQHPIPQSDHRGAHELPAESTPPQARRPLSFDDPLREEDRDSIARKLESM